MTSPLASRIPLRLRAAVCGKSALILPLATAFSPSLANAEETTVAYEEVGCESPAAGANELQFAQLHAIAIGDMDGDGLQDIVTGKSWWAHGPTKDPKPNAPAVLYVFRQVRSPEGKATFLPQLVDSDAGVGTQIALADINRDGRLDILTSNKKGTYVFVS